MPPAKDPSSVPSTHTGWLITTYNSSSRGAGVSLLTFSGTVYTQREDTHTDKTVQTDTHILSYSVRHLHTG